MGAESLSTRFTTQPTDTAYGLFFYLEEQSVQTSY